MVRVVQRYTVIELFRLTECKVGFSIAFGRNARISLSPAALY